MRELGVVVGGWLGLNLQDRRLISLLSFGLVVQLEF